MVIDGYPVIGEYISEKASDIVNDVIKKWKLSHVRSSPYLLPIDKSSYKNVVKDRFLPPPFTRSQSLDNGLKWTRSIAMSGVIPTFVQRKYPLGISYDVSNPAVKYDLIKRKCSIFGMYFDTIKIMSNHHQSCRHVDDNDESNDASDVENSVERVRPLRIAAIRQREFLCILRMQEKNCFLMTSNTTTQKYLLRKIGRYVIIEWPLNT